MQLPDAIRDCICFVEATRGNNRGLIGTAFFVSVPNPILGLDDSHVYAVTAKHVVDPKYARSNPKPPWDSIALRVNTRDGGMDTIDAPLMKWHRVDGSDVAVLSVSPPKDKFAFLHYPISSAADAAFRNEHRIGPGEDVVITGLLRHHPGIERNLPIIRVGNLAALPTDPILLDTGPEPHAALVEIRSIGGLSGSPAFIHLGDVRRNVEGELGLLRWESGSLAGSNYLLGVVHGYFPTRGSPIDHLSVRQGDEPLNTGITIVVPVERIHEIIYGEKLTEERQAKERAMKDEWNEENMPTPASAELSDRELDRTSDLLGKLFQVPKDEADEVHRGHDQP